LKYALKNSVGEMLPEHLIPAELLKLREKGEYPGSVDYWQTLKIYLDNEMNASKTAQDLFIHRATLHVRLNRILDSLDLSTAENRMFIRYCLYLYELFEGKAD
jgi:DNA-binding PucR family transcriptional regulator